MLRLLQQLKWRLGAVGLVIAVSFGMLSGVGAFTFQYAGGASYFSTDPAGM